MFCGHCQQDVPKSTYYRHQSQYCVAAEKISDSEESNGGVEIHSDHVDMNLSHTDHEDSGTESELDVIDAGNPEAAEVCS